MNAQQPQRAVVVEPTSETAKMARAVLDERIDLGEVECELSALGDFLMTKLAGVPVFIDGRAVKMASLTEATVINGKISEMPVRSALRRLLQPYGLRVVVEEEGLVVTADFTALTRRGVATDRWVGDSKENEQIRAQLKEKVSVDYRDVPLSQAMDALAEQLNIPVVIDQRALEEIGLSTDEPVSLSLKNISARSTLRLMLRELDLCYRVQDDSLQITTVEIAEMNLMNRIYFLEGTGVPIGDIDTIIELVQASVVPDTWEALGGPSTIVPMTLGNGNRPSILVSTVHDAHEQIEALLLSMRDSHVGTNPKAKLPKKSAGAGSSPAVQQGGMF